MKQLDIMFSIPLLELLLQCSKLLARCYHRRETSYQKNIDLGRETATPKQLIKENLLFSIIFAKPTETKKGNHLFCNSK